MDESLKTEENNITMLRNYNYIGGAEHFWPLVNDVAIAGIYSKQHVSFKLAPGQYSLGVRCIGVPLPIWYTDKVDVVIKEGRHRYFLLSRYALGCAEIEEIEEAEATERLKESPRITTGRISDCRDNSLPYEGYEWNLCFSKALP